MILGIKAVDEGNDLGVAKVEMVSTELLAAKRRTVVCEGQAVSWCVELGDNLYAHRLSIADEVTHLLLRIAAVDSGKAREEVALHAESSLRLVPVVVILVFEAIVVKVQLQGVHLVVRHDVDERIEVAHREELAAAVEHKATHGIVGLVGNGAARQEPLSHSALVDVARFLHLNQCLRSPQGTAHRSGLDDDALFIDGHAIAFVAKFLVGLD